MTRGRCVLAAMGVVAAMLILYLWPGPFVRTGPAAPPLSVVRLRHVFVIVMENHGPASLLAPSAPDPYIRRLMATAGTDTNYFGVTHPSLPNYVALLAGRTDGTHSDSPTQTFQLPNLALQLDDAGITWQAAMQSLPYAGYTGSWYPDTTPHAVASVTPPTALYAKKHDPFMLFPAVVRRNASRIVPLATLGHELADNQVPQFVWITPNLCDDMHGQPDGPGAQCPVSNSARLIRDGNSFLARWIRRIQQSRAWGPGSAIFITWDESGGPRGVTPASIAAYKAAGPGAPALVKGAPWLGVLGGGRVPLIVLTDKMRARTIHLWADHYSILKTIEASWHLPLLGQAQDRNVPVLSVLLP
jgi:hypothetical protein